jgi:hypothetical protein
MDEDTLHELALGVTLLAEPKPGQLASGVDFSV